MAAGTTCSGAGCTGAAFALKRMMQADGAAGTIRVFGCASEESQGVKVYFVRDGSVRRRGRRACLAPRPGRGDRAPCARRPTTRIRIMFRGRTAHAGNSPWDGRSALDAAELFGHGINLMREHVRPTARLHYIYEAAGVAPNVVPDFAQVWLTIRDENRAQVYAMTEWARQIAEGAALATQTRGRVRPVLRHVGPAAQRPADRADSIAT